MMSVLFVGDPHLKAHRILPRVERVVDDHRVGEVVFLGDMCDDWDATARQAAEDVELFARWTLGQRAAGLKVTALAGNHDLPYLAAPRTPLFWRYKRQADGFKPRAHERIHRALTAVKPVAAWRSGRVLATHAGVTGAWAAWAGLGDGPERALNAMLEADPWPLFDMAGPARGGDSMPSPLWADGNELEADPWDGWLQVVGHTPVPTVTNAGLLWFCDTYTDGDGTMLLMDGEAFRIVR